jgi:hypothetical protein
MGHNLLNPRRAKKATPTMTMTYREARELLTQSGRGANEAQDILDDLPRKGADYKGFSVKTESGVRWLRYSGLRAGSLQPEYTMREL